MHLVPYSAVPHNYIKRIFKLNLFNVPAASVDKPVLVATKIINLLLLLLNLQLFCSVLVAISGSSFVFANFVTFKNLINKVFVIELTYNILDIFV